MDQSEHERWENEGGAVPPPDPRMEAHPTHEQLDKVTAVVVRRFIRHSLQRKQVTA